MNQINILIEKRTYNRPRIELIELDNEISLVLQSDDNPEGEPTFSQIPEHFINDAFKTSNV